MRSIHRSGHGGRPRTRRASRSSCALVAVVVSLALRPAIGAAQLSFVVTEQVESRLVAALVQTPALESSSGLGPEQSVPVTEAAPRDAAEVLAERTVEVAGRYVGTRYRWGGAAPRQGFDCSGFVRFVFAEQGIELPRTARQQARAGRSVPARLDDLRPGDLLFFAQRGPGVDHVAIYAGDGRIVHASRRGYGVRYDDLTGARGDWYARRLVSVRRVIEPAEPVPAGATDESRDAAPLLGEALEPGPAGADVISSRGSLLPGELEAGS